MVMKSQSDIFFEGEGDKWFDRNASISAPSQKDDPVIEFIEKQELHPTSILEIGCANGHRLEALRTRFNAACTGVDVSEKAINEGSRLFPELDLKVAKAGDTQLDSEAYDLVIFGFCLYLCDRHDLFKIAYEADRLLRSDGYIVIYDFHTPTPYKNQYAHLEGLFSYKMDHSKLFTWHPQYTLFAMDMITHSDRSLRKNTDERVAISLLYKALDSGFPENLSPEINK